MRTTFRRGLVKYIRVSTATSPHRACPRPVPAIGAQWLAMAVILLGVCGGAPSWLQAQEPEKGKPITPQDSAPEKQDLTLAPTKVDVNPIAHDEEIQARLQSVLVATGWFTDPRVEVKEGVAFLNGRSENEELKKWAGDLARNTQDVVAVANRMEVTAPSVWDFRPAWNGLLSLWRDFVLSLPFVLFGLVILAASAGIGLMATRGSAEVLRRKVTAPLLRNVIARGIGGLVFLFGVYIILRVSGLTQLALTVIGGTGLIGLAVGIAFRDITENFLASVFLSLQRRFETGDLIEVAGVTGYVQQLNVRTTIVMTLEGHLVQVPNATLYKSTLRNFTANVNRREDFVVGIGYDDSISDAQEIARKVLADHPGVLNDPEPSVLADSLGTSTVNLRIYFWLNGREHSWLKMRSSVIRLVKRAFQQHGISMPDEAREVVFPHGVPVRMLDASPQEHSRSGSLPSADPGEEHDASTKAEGGLSSEAKTLEDQAKQVKPLQERENLLRPTAPAPSA